MSGKAWVRICDALRAGSVPSTTDIDAVGKFFQFSCGVPHVSFVPPTLTLTSLGDALPRGQTPAYSPSSPPTSSSSVQPIPHTTLKLDCIICTDILGSNGGVEANPCMCVFCAGCIAEWRKQSDACPKCRSSMTTGLPIEEKV